MRRFLIIHNFECRQDANSNPEPAALQHAQLIIRLLQQQDIAAYFCILLFFIQHWPRRQFTTHALTPITQFPIHLYTPPRCLLPTQQVAHLLPFKLLGNLVIYACTFLNSLSSAILSLTPRCHLPLTVVASLKYLIIYGLIKCCPAIRVDNSIHCLPRLSAVASITCTITARKCYSSRAYYCGSHFVFPVNIWY